VVQNPALRSEIAARTELRRLSGDLSVCETKLAKLPREVLARSADWRSMTASEWKLMDKAERLAL
jgi:hypothetical protein